MDQFNDEYTTLFGETNFRGQKRRFGIKRKDRRRHMYIIGKTGMGKTTLLENMTIQDIQSGEGVGIVDPHGEYAERMLDFVPSSRVNDVVYFNPSDLDFPIAFNVMEDVGPDRRHLVSSGLLGVFKKIWGPEVWSGRMEYLLSNSILALLETPGTTLLGINRILADKDYRKRIVANIKDPIVKAFWENEYARYTEKFATEAGAAVQNKIGQFTSNPLIRNIIGQPKSTIDMRRIMDERKIFIMNLSKGRIGEENARLLGAMLITRLYLAAMTRVDMPEQKRPDFYLYVDEFQNFATESFANILSEARKYRLNLILAHQYVEQMDETVRAAVFGNVGSLLTFRIGATDAELMEKELFPEFTQKDLVNLGFANIYLRLMIDGVASRPFSAETLPPGVGGERSYRDEIIQASRKLYGRDRKEIEQEILEWQGFGPEREGAIIARARTGPPRPTDGLRPDQRERSSERPLRRATDGIAREFGGTPSSEGTPYRADLPRAPAESGMVRGGPGSGPAPYRAGGSGSGPAPYRAGGSGSGPARISERSRPPVSPREHSRPVFDIRHASPKQAEQKQKQPFVPLASLKRNEEKKEPPQRKKVDFSELKKALSESFSPKTGAEEKRSVVHDRTGMIRPASIEASGARDSSSPDASAAAKKPEEERKGTSAGVLKPGERIRF